ncbi:crotonobetaine/carnitine-CoA ligase [Caproiciproducens sp. NJN-50]|uniref:AMP-binding protein n=1 Tax=Acutalibacteraceae TaxID=3082771 RepID=UPI000FFE2284|nr:MULTISPECIES: AMP-binding protein [Acutalibacteraceae]QAT50765.1 crotonobetaine/carnitine-CoA ligase [Caproiciproducens sp. NJN-50]
MTNIVGNRTLRSQWDETVRFYKDRTFLEFVSVEDEVTSYSYSDFDRMVKQTANLFLELGIKQNELVATHLHNTPQYLICWLALAQIGAVTVPMNEHYKLDESAYVLQKCGIHRLIAEPRSIDLFAEEQSALGLDTIILTAGGGERPGLVCLEKEMPRQPAALKENRTVSPDDTAVILFTSGTTRHPKGAVYTHSNVVYGGLLHVAQMGMSEGDRFLSSMPCYHMDFQEMAAMPVICTGSTLIMVEHYSARRFWSQVCRYKANFTDTMSIMNRTMMMQPVQPWEKDHCLKQIYFSMGLCDIEKERFESRFHVRLLNSYGMTETVSGVTCVPLTGDQHWPSVGRPALSYEIKIIDCDGNEVPPNTPGEICVHGVPGKTIIPGYYQDPKASAKLIDRDNWLHSGDMGYLDEGGWLFFMDRMSDMIKRSGENISSEEVEYVLTSHEKIADAAVIGVPDPIRDQAVKAYVQLAENQSMTESEVVEYCSQHLSKFKVPTVVEFVGEFPRTATGKIKKQLLRQKSLSSPHCPPKST